MRIRGVLLSFALAAITLQVSGQSTAEMIEQAKAMGVSDAQIQSAMNSQNSTSLTDGTVASTTEPTRSEVIPTTDDQRAENVSEGKKLKVKEVFGRDIFTNDNLTFLPDFNIPTPKDYVLSAGDEVRVNIWGNSQLDITQVISPEGRIFIDEFGPIQLSGLSVEDAEARVKRELSKIFKGLNDGTNMISVTLGNIRSIKVNIVGEAYAPGTYTLPSLSTLFNALYAAGGVNDIGSLRSIKLFRNGKMVEELDVYDYLLGGDSKSNVRLESGDMIMVTPYESLVATEGELKRNRLFEMKSEETLSDVLNMAGGFSGAALTDYVDVQRKAGLYYSIKRVNKNSFANEPMFDGDTVTVRKIAMRYDNRLDIDGAVWYPGVYELNDEVQSVKQLVEAAQGLKGDEFAGRALITRINPDFTKSIIAVDIKGIMNGTVEDVTLQKDDKLSIPSLFDLQEKQTLKVSGAVNAAIDTMDYRYNMTVEDAIVKAGGLMESAAEVNVDISRRVKDPLRRQSPERPVEVFTIQLIDGLAISESGEPIILQPFDEIYVRFSPGYRKQEVVTIGGEVPFRGVYVLKSVNSRVSDVVRDAGGIGNNAYVRGASLMRKINEDEQNRVDAILEMTKVNDSKDSLTLASVDIDRYPVGIDLAAALAKPGSADDIVLRDGDIIFIPKEQSTVKISGSVVYPNSVTYTKKMNAKDCISQAGGYNDYAKKRRPAVIYMNGQVASTKKVALFFKKYPKIEPGCEVVVYTKRSKDRTGMAGEIMGVATSATTMASLIATMLR